MQNVEASVAFFWTFVRTCPAGEPASLIVRQVVLPKQPWWGPVPWPGQNRPVELVVLAGPVVSGERLIAIAPTCAPSQQAPPPGVQGQLLAGHPLGVPGPPGHGVATEPTPPVGQSRVMPVELVEVQGSVARGPRSQVPVYGGVPTGTHFGHGWARLKVK
jgi:hypothetical protein